MLDLRATATVQTGIPAIVMLRGDDTASCRIFDRVGDDMRLTAFGGTVLPDYFCIEVPAEAGLMRVDVTWRGDGEVGVHVVEHEPS